MLTSQMIKEAALAAGADLCGIGNMERFEGAPPDMDPRHPRNTQHKAKVQRRQISI